MVNIREPLINVVIGNKPKVLTRLARADRLGPKDTGSSIGAPNSPIADDVPPAKRRDLIHAGWYLHGTCQAHRSPARDSEPQGTLTGLWVKDGGRSERLSVMGRRGVASHRDYITPRASGLTSQPSRSSQESLVNRRRRECK